MGGGDSPRGSPHRVDPWRQHATDAPDSPHRMRRESAARASGAEIDEWAPPADIAKLQAARGGADAARIEWYPGAEHGFVFPTRVPIYNRVAAERHWERLLSLFERNLRRRA
jgi:carboxymethylenebutenolidase